MDEREKAILAIDPGKDKCGLAIVNYSLLVLSKKIVDRIELQSYLSQLINIYDIREIIIGDGTFYNEVLKEIKGITDIPVKIVDEAYTTMEAEKRYWQEKGWLWKKLLFFHSLETGKADWMTMLLLYWQNVICKTDKWI